MVRRLRGQKAAEYSQSGEYPRERREIDQTQSDSDPRLLAQERLGSIVDELANRVLWLYGCTSSEAYTSAGSSLTNEIHGSADDQQRTQVTITEQFS
jgi:hypothetical protein